MNTRGLLLALGVITISAAGLGADAFVTLPGASCTPITGGTFAYYKGTVSNRSTSSELKVICPIQRSNAMSGGELLHLDIAVLNRNSSRDFSCTAQSERIEDDTFYSYSRTSKSRGYGSDVRLIEFSDIYVDGWDDYQYVTCDVPRAVGSDNSHLVSLRYTHN
jgi:hypothetical protein